MLNQLLWLLLSGYLNLGLAVGLTCGALLLLRPLLKRVLSPPAAAAAVDDRLVLRLYATGIPACSPTSMCSRSPSGT